MEAKEQSTEPAAIGVSQSNGTPARARHAHESLISQLFTLLTDGHSLHDQIVVVVRMTMKYLQNAAIHTDCAFISLALGVIVFFCHVPAAFAAMH
jgi:hypothetical protein